MKLLNKSEVNEWLFDHCQIQGHILDGVKGEPGTQFESINVAFEDRSTGERIECNWGCDGC